MTDTIPTHTMTTTTMTAVATVSVAACIHATAGEFDEPKFAVEQSSTTSDAGGSASINLECSSRPSVRIRKTGEMHEQIRDQDFDAGNVRNGAGRGALGHQGSRPPR